MVQLLESGDLMTCNTRATNLPFNYSLDSAAATTLSPWATPGEKTHTLTHCDIQNIPTIHHLRKGPCWSSYVRHLTWRAFLAAHNPDEQSPGAARGSCSVTDQAGSKDWIWKSLIRAGRDNVRKHITIFLLRSERHNPSFSAICCLLSGNCTTSLPHITAANHPWVEEERYRNTTCRQHYSRLHLWYTSPSYQQATACLVSRAPRAHVNGSNNGDSMRSLKGSNQGYTVKMFECQLKSPCWSYNLLHWSPATMMHDIGLTLLDAVILSMKNTRNIGKYTQWVLHINFSNSSNFKFRCCYFMTLAWWWWIKRLSGIWGKQHNYKNCS